MPWSVQDPPKCALNWTDEEKGKCVEAAKCSIEGWGFRRRCDKGLHQVRWKDRTSWRRRQNRKPKGIELQPVTAEDVSVYQNLFMGSDSLPTELLKVYQR